MSLNFLTAALFAIAGFALGLRQILLQPNQASFPCAPRGVRVAMFMGAAMLGYLAALFWGERPQIPFAGQAANAVAVLAGLLALYFMAMLVNLLAQRYPPKMWEKINRHSTAMRKVRANTPKAPSQNGYLRAGRHAHH
jgi:hypothetical protein